MTLRLLKRRSWMPRIAGLSHGKSTRSRPVMTALTPGSAAAFSRLMALMRACGWGLRKTLPTSMPGSVESAPNAARPVTLSTPSGRIVRFPIHLLLAPFPVILLFPVPFITLSCRPHRQESAFVPRTASCDFISILQGSGRRATVEHAHLATIACMPRPRWSETSTLRSVPARRPLQAVARHAVAQGLARDAKPARRRHHVLAVALKRRLDDELLHGVEAHRAIERQGDHIAGYRCLRGRAWPDRQPFRGQVLAGGEKNRSFHHVAQLPHVAGPLVVGKQRPHCVRDARHALAGDGVEFGDESVDELVDIRLADPQ